MSIPLQYQSIPPYIPICSSGLKPVLNWNSIHAITGITCQIHADTYPCLILLYCLQCKTTKNALGSLMFFGCPLITYLPKVITVSPEPSAHLYLDCHYEHWFLIFTTNTYYGDCTVMTARLLWWLCMPCLQAIYPIQWMMLFYFGCRSSHIKKSAAYSAPTFVLTCPTWIQGFLLAFPPVLMPAWLAGSVWRSHACDTLRFIYWPLHCCTLRSHPDSRNMICNCTRGWAGFVGRYLSSWLEPRSIDYRQTARSSQYNWY